MRDSSHTHSYKTSMPKCFITDALTLRWIVRIDLSYVMACFGQPPIPHGHMSLVSHPGGAQSRVKGAVEVVRASHKDTFCAPPGWPPEGGPRADPGDAGEIISLGWHGNALVLPWKGCRRWPGRGRSGLLKMDRWVDISIKVNIDMYIVSICTQLTINN